MIMDAVEQVMGGLYPTSFLELVAGVTAVAAVVLAGLSLRSRSRGHTTRMFAILFATSLALFSNHWTTYFAALFIVATTVTELEFLQNLAAIIRGNKPYFDYKKELVSPEETERKSDTKIDPGTGAVEPAPTEKRPQKQGPARGTRLTFRGVVEQLAARKLSEMFGSPVELHVRFVSNGLRVEVEGVIQGDSLPRDKLFGFEYVRGRAQSAQMIDSIHHLDELAPPYSAITRRACEAHLVVVVIDNNELPERVAKDVQRAVDLSKYVVSLRVLTRRDIGLDLVDDATLVSKEV